MSNTARDFEAFPLTPVKELWVIEAPGKAQTLQAILKRLHLDARVFATKGHLLSFPDKLFPVGIDAEMREVERTAKDPDRVRRLREEAAMATRVVIATDADLEGDVIAWDVADILSDIHPAPMRVKLRGMDEESVLQAADEGKPVSMQDAVPGRARAIIDRLIGATFSRDGVAVGRVGTAMLGLFSPEHRPAGEAPLTNRKLRLCAPASDNGKPWVADTSVVPPMDAGIAERLRELVLPRMGIRGRTEETRVPNHTGGILSRAADVMGLSPTDTMKSLQRNYEAGRMSYPRSASAALSESAISKISDIIRKANQRFDAERVAIKGKGDVHDAPHPLGPPPNLSTKPNKTDVDEGLRILVTGDLVRTGQVQVVELPDTEPLLAFLKNRGFPAIIIEMVVSMKWRRETGVRYPGQESWQQSETYERPAAAVLLDRMVEIGLGRPSTWASHVDGFLSRSLIDDTMRLTDKGRKWMEISPDALLNPKLSAAIEGACERMVVQPAPGELPWEALARTILSKVPVAIRDPVMATAASLPALPERPDPWAGMRIPVKPALAGMDMDMLDPDADMDAHPVPLPPASMFPQD